MPEGLADLLAIQGGRDLFAFLMYEDASHEWSVKLDLTGDRTTFV